MSDDVLAQLLDDLDRTLGRYVAFPTDHARHAVAVWIVHCWVMDAFESTPRLALLSPEKGSGKTRCMEVIELHVPNPMLTINVSAAALFRKVAQGGITVLLDEADTYLGFRVAKEHEDLRGLVNAGHRRGTKVIRAAVTGKGVKVEEFPAFAPVALAGLGDLPDTIMDRAVIIAMRRRRPDEQVEPFRFRKVERAATDLSGRLEEWAGSAVERIEDDEPDMPEGITDRPADVWEPLIILGDAAGEAWSERIRAAAVALNTERAERDPSLGTQLLADCRRIFDAGDADRLTTESLIEKLGALDDAPWGDLRGKPIDARGLSRRLKKFQVRPADHRFGDSTKKGYLRTDFHDAWTRYLPAVAHVAHVAHFEQNTRADVAPTEARGGGLGVDSPESPADGALFPPSSESGQQGQQGQQRTCDVCGEAPAPDYRDTCVDCISAAVADDPCPF